MRGRWALEVDETRGFMKAVVDADQDGGDDPAGTEAMTVGRGGTARRSVRGRRAERVARQRTLHSHGRTGRSANFA